MKEKKMLAIDLDGTALDDQGRLSRTNIEMLKKVQENNGVVCFVTGRRDVDMAPIKPLWPLADCIIMNNGAKIMDGRSGRVIENACIDPKDAQIIANFCLSQNLLLHVFYGHNWWVNSVSEGVKSYAREIQLEPKVYSSISEVPLDCVEGFVVTSQAELVEDYIKREGLNLYSIESQVNCIDIIRGGMSKWNAIRRVAREMDIQVKNIIAVGNYTNDIDMIVNAGIGVAVQNALENVKKAADYITRSSNNQNAIGEIVERFILREDV